MLGLNFKRHDTVSVSEIDKSENKREIVTFNTCNVHVGCVFIRRTGWQSGS